MPNNTGLNPGVIYWVIPNGMSPDNSLKQPFAVKIVLFQFQEVSTKYIPKETIRDLIAFKLYDEMRR